MALDVSPRAVVHDDLVLEPGMFELAEETQLRLRLSETMRYVVSQRLAPRAPERRARERMEVARPLAAGHQPARLPADDRCIKLHRHQPDRLVR